MPLPSHPIDVHHMADWLVESGWTSATVIPTDDLSLAVEIVSPGYELPGRRFHAAYLTIWPLDAETYTIHADRLPYAERTLSPMEHAPVVTDPELDAVMHDLIGLVR